ncbi:hypothetical protein LBMAG44_13340 [Gemmatimonadota bacterium]|nr:hypothetical protein LBMAG44_13340 [Gemmatimonadota bacterium]
MPVVAEVVVAAGAVAVAAGVLAEPAHQASGRRIAELSDVQWIQSGITCLTGPGAPRWRAAMAPAIDAFREIARALISLR